MKLEPGVIQIRKLTEDDYDALKNMQTGIDEDYVVHIFQNLVNADSHALYGLFEGNKMLTIAGYSIFANHFAVLGRLRSDQRYQSKGHATELLQYIVEELKQMDTIKWIGAATHEPNKAARKVMDKLAIPQNVPYHSLVLKDSTSVAKKNEPIWNLVFDETEKRKLLQSIKNNQLGMFPYECYYPLPFEEELFDEKYLAECYFYQNEDKNRFVIIMDDRKGDWYAHIKYFWNDHYEQPGFWETINQYLTQNPNDVGAWIDFSPEGFNNIPDLSPFDVQEPWMMYGKWIK